MLRLLQLNSELNGASLEKIEEIGSQIRTARWLLIPMTGLMVSGGIFFNIGRRGRTQKPEPVEFIPSENVDASSLQGEVAGTDDSQPDSRV